MTIPQGATDITQPDQLPRVTQALGKVKEFSVDVEADAMHAFHARLCFVQIGTDDDIFLLDTLQPGVEIASQAAVFADPGVTKFFHAAGGDLQYLAEAGIRVKGLFDTHRATTLLGWAKVGLADLVQEKLQVKLLKEHQQSDFSLRPLPPGMRDYIADDVRYLTDIGRMVREACEKAAILEEVELDCARMADEAARRPDLATEFKPKIPKGGLSGNQIRLAEVIAWELHRKRLEWAQKEDLPFGRMLSNAAVGAISANPPTEARDLQRREGVRSAFVREHGEEVLAMIKEKIALQRDGKLPEAAPEEARDPKRKRREDALTDFRKSRAIDRKVTASVVLSNPLIEALARVNPKTLEELQQIPYVGEKRVRLYGADLLRLLQTV
ncbi:MAG: putative ribonuclease [Myxococcaceae bacterium]|nr:putative ribonuclease [Myxococcaceae bacterium]